MSAFKYLPILKSKPAELASLLEVPEVAKVHITPLIEIIPETKGTIESHLHKIATQIIRGCGEYEHIYVDFCDAIDPLARIRNETAFERVIDHVELDDVRVVPVTRLTGRSLVFQDTVRKIHARDKFGVCLRITERDFHPRTLRTNVSDLIEFLGVEYYDLDVIVDLGSITVDEVYRMALAVETLVASLSDVDSYRSLTVASSGFPENMSVCERNAITRIARADSILYEELLSRNELPRVPAYGDYAIQHPTLLTNFDPTKMRISAAIRYSGERDYVISKGRMVTGEGWEQTTELAKRLIEQPEFRGAGFSAAEDYIVDRARGVNSAGSPTLWRRIGTTQHLTLAAEQFASVNAT